MRTRDLAVVIFVASCGQSLEGPKPSVAGVTSPVPPVVCNAQLETPVVVAGDGLAPLVEGALTDPNAVLPAITVVHSDGTRTTIPDPIDGSHVTWQSQQQMTFVVDESLGLAPGTYDIEICNRREGTTPQELPSGDCVTFNDGLLVVPPPVVTATEPDLVCTEDGDNTVRLVGTGFLDIAGTLPTITVGEGKSAKVYDADEASLGDCTDLGFGVQSCLTLTFTVPTADLEPSAELLASLTYDITVRNPEPAACVSDPSEAVDLTVVPSPTVTSVVPDLICTARGANTLTVNGADFLSIEGVLPTVNVGTNVYAADTIGGTCAAVPGPNGAVQRCDSLTFSVPIADLAPDAELEAPATYDVTVTNPLPVADTTLTPCTSDTPVLLTVVPPPSVTSVVPALICTAQGDNVVTVNGADFLTIDGTLPTIDVGAVATITYPADSIGGTCVVVPGPAGDVQRCDTLTFTVPMGDLAPGDYDVTVTNPMRNAATMLTACTSSPPVTLTVVPPPVLTAIDPIIGAQGTTVLVTLTGTDFRDGMAVTLDAVPAVAGTSVTVFSPVGATALFDLTGVTPGTYDVTVTNPEGCSSTLVGAFTVFVPSIITLVGIDPPFGCTCQNTTVTITSVGDFVSTPRVEMRPAGMTNPVVTFERVAFIDANTLTAVVPAGAAIGDYDVTVINPPSDGGIGTLPSGFRVVSLPVLSIEAVVPGRGDPGADTPVSIFGEEFRDPVTIEIIDRTGAVVGTVASVTPLGTNQIDVVLPTNGLPEDAYLIRVTNLDENTYSTFASFIVASIGPSGNLHGFSDEANLNTGRRMLAGASARDPIGNHYVYAIGGDTGTAGSVLDTVEVSQLSKFGALSAWSTVRNTLVSPRVGATAVAVPIFDPMGSPFVPVKTYLYVLGGMDDTGAVLASIERALVLSTNDAPRVTSIGASATPGTLAAGTWYYKVSAILDATDPDNPGGETISSDEQILTIGGAGGAIDLNWDPVVVNGIPAASYRIYRTDAVNGISQTEHLVATVGGTSATDTGDAAGIESPLPPGATGVWTVEAGMLTVARWGHQTTLVTDSAGNLLLYTAGGKSDATTGYLTSVEYSLVSDVDGTLGAFGTGGVTDLPQGAAFFSVVVESPQDVSGYIGDGRLMALGGVVAGATTQDFLISDVTPAGGNGAWNPYGGAGGIQARGGPMAVITSEKLFVFGGAGTTTDTTFSAIRTGIRDVGFLGDGSLDSPIQSAADTLNPARALGIGVIGSGFIYLVGGTSTGDDALTSTVKTF